MKTNFILCLDDSGTRHPTRDPGRKPAHGYDWFAMGGILFREDDELKIKELHKKFCERWNVSAPLHSSEIRAKANNFSFIGRLEKAEQENFYEELYCLMRDIPAYGFACVVDRSCYNDRYLEKYDASKRWLLCKSAFSIASERAAKFVHMQSGRLRIFVERSDKKTDQQMKQYYDELRGNGMPFNQVTSKKYIPATSNFLHSTLFEFRTKNKSSVSMQLADLYTWPICMGGYNADCRPYKRLCEDNKLLDSKLSEDQVGEIGIKYYCFDKEKPSS